VGLVNHRKSAATNANRGKSEMHAHRDANGPAGGADWTSVNWRKAERTVRNLRQRNFRAAQQGDMRRVHALQKLMLRSHSNTLVSVRRVTQQNAGRYTPGVDKVVVKTTPSARAARRSALDDASLAHPTRAARLHPQSDRQTSPARNPDHP
jgi:RNA-directed DNA polymerase